MDSFPAVFVTFSQSAVGERRTTRRLVLVIPSEILVIADGGGQNVTQTLSVALTDNILMPSLPKVNLFTFVLLYSADLDIDCV